MPIKKSAKKALRASVRKERYNKRRKVAMRDSIKEYRTLVKTSPKEAANIVAKMQQAIDKATKAGIIKRGNANRKKSRLSRLLVTN